MLVRAVFRRLPCCAPALGRAVATNPKVEKVLVSHPKDANLKAPDVAHFLRRPRKGDDLNIDNLFTSPVWSTAEKEGVEITHHAPTDVVDKLAYGAVTALRSFADFGSGYVWKSRGLAGTKMRETDWLRRIIFLETVAGVPGMVAGVMRHFRSLRLMKRDHGWIHSLLAEAENERMHLLIALRLRKPGILFRAAVIIAQGIFVPCFTIAYFICPRFCHRFVGYLEEEAVKTYTKLLVEIDKGHLPLFENLKAPLFASTYYQLPSNAKIRDVFECIRADESHHRDANHHFACLDNDTPNKFTDHLRNHGAKASTPVSESR